MTLYDVSCGEKANSKYHRHSTDSWLEVIRWLSEHLTKGNPCRVALIESEDNSQPVGLTKRPDKMPETPSEWAYLAGLYEKSLIQAQEKNSALRIKINSQAQRLENQRITIISMQDEAVQYVELAEDADITQATLLKAIKNKNMLISEFHDISCSCNICENVNSLES